MIRFLPATLCFAALAGCLVVSPAHAAPQDTKAQDAQANKVDSALLKDAQNRASKVAGKGESNQRVASPKRLEDSLPLTSEADRTKTAKILQQLTVDLLATFNNYKQMHWNVSGPLYLSLHEFYQQNADMYRKYADTFAERVLSVGYSVDGRYATIAKTTLITEMPAGYVSDDASIKLLIDRVTILQKEVYRDIRATNDSDPTTSNQLQSLAYDIDKNLWQLRIHLQKPGGTGDNLPYAPANGSAEVGVNP